MSEQIQGEFTSKSYESLMRIRIKKVLMICSNYDAFIMEEDGRIESRIKKEYSELNISNPPAFIWANSSEAAAEILSQDSAFDLVICMYNEQDKGIFSFAEKLKTGGCSIPFVLLMHYSKEIRRKVTEQMQKSSVVDYIFSWHGNADLILAIIKLLEDRMNAENDILNVGVQAILLVEDSIRCYSTYLTSWSSHRATNFSATPSTRTSRRTASVQGRKSCLQHATMMPWRHSTNTGAIFSASSPTSGW